MTTKIPNQDLNHANIDPKDGKEHVNHGMIEYTEEDLKMHNDAFHDHTEEEVNPVSYTHLTLPTICSV